MKPEHCENCRNVEHLYWRRNRRVCLNCATLNPQWSRVKGADHPNFLDPVNQPNALGTSVQKAQPCVWCVALTRSRYLNATTKGYKIIFACGWAHAGYWMDTKIEQMQLIEGEAYVRKSLGVELPKPLA